MTDIDWDPDGWALDIIQAQVCPICGQHRTKAGAPMRQVLNHIQQVHGYSSREVRIKLRVARSYPLTDPGYHEFKVAQGLTLGNLTPEARAKSIEVRRQNGGRTMTPAAVDAARASIVKAIATRTERDEKGRFV